MARILFQVLKNIANKKNSKKRHKFLENVLTGPKIVVFCDRTNNFLDEKRGYPGGRLSIKFIVYDAALFNFDGYF